MKREHLNYPTPEKRPDLDIADHFKDGRSLVPGCWEPVFTDRKPTPEEMDADTGGELPDYFVWVCEPCRKEGKISPCETAREDTSKGNRPGFIHFSFCQVHGPVMSPPGLVVGN